MPQPFLHAFLNDLVDQIEASKEASELKSQLEGAADIPDDDDDCDCACDCTSASVGFLAESLLANYLSSCIDRNVLPAGESLQSIAVLTRLIDDYS